MSISLVSQEGELWVRNLRELRLNHTQTQSGNAVPEHPRAPFRAQTKPGTTMIMARAIAALAACAAAFEQRVCPGDQPTNVPASE